MIFALSDAVWLALIASTPATLAAIGAIAATLRNGRKIEQIHKATNSLVDRLVSSASTEGELRGASDERHRADAKRDA